MESQRRMDLIENAPDEVRKQVSAMLDQISQPLTVREIDNALAPYISRSLRRAAVHALKQLHIIAIVPGENATERPV